jgi:predicted dehydrogenase
MVPANYGHSKPENPLNQHIAFVAAVRDGLPVPVPAEIGWFDVAVVKAGYHSAETGRRVTIEEMLK